ncbi:hypothetical protein ABPG72_018370 [Tetrahymena utriculariae]
MEGLYKNTGINNNIFRKNTQYAIYISAPILYIIRLQIQDVQKKNEDKDKIAGYTYAMASLITMTIQEYLIKESLMNKEEKMNVEDFKMLIMNTFQKGVKDAYKINHIIQINKDEKSPIFAAINIAKDNVSKFTKKN